jgi:hypothetical protein
MRRRTEEQLRMRSEVGVVKHPELSEVKPRVLTRNEQEILEIRKKAEEQMRIRDEHLANNATQTNNYQSQYNEAYNKPREPKQAGDGFNMEWTGQWLDNMVVQSKKDSFSIFSRDGKQKILEKKYGVLTKLTEQHNTIFNEEVMKPKLYQYVLENMFKVGDTVTLVNVIIDEDLNVRVFAEANILLATTAPAPVGVILP